MKYALSIKIYIHLLLLIPIIIYPQSDNHLLSFQNTKSLTPSQISFLYDSTNSSLLNKYLSAIEFAVDSIKIIKEDGSLEKQIYNYDSIQNLFYELYKIWDGTNWVNDWKHVYIYNSRGNLISRCRDSWVNDSWDRIWCFDYEFDENDNLLSETFKYKSSNGNWNKSKRTLRTYNNLNQNIHILDELWNGTEWIENWQAEYGYDERGNRNDMFSQKFVSGNWINEAKSIFNFDANRNILFYQIQKGDGPDGWINDKQYSYSYNENNNMLSSLIDKWYVNKWSNVDSAIFEYDTEFNLVNEYHFDKNDSSRPFSYWYSYQYNLENRKTQELIKVKLDSIWLDNSRNIYEYDGSGNLIKEQGEMYTISEWAPMYRVTYKIENDLVTNVIFENVFNDQWNPKDGFYTIHDPTERIYYLTGYNIKIYYSAITAVANTQRLPNEISLSQNYPNPFNPSTTIKYSIPQNEYVTLKVFDILGREVETLLNKQQQPGYYEVSFDAHGFASGIYYYKLQVGSFIKTKKMILMK